MTESFQQHLLQELQGIGTGASRQFGAGVAAAAVAVHLGRCHRDETVVLEEHHNLVNVLDSFAAGHGAVHAVDADLADLVDIAAGSIVSRTLAENDAGTLTLFAFDAGQGLSEHSAPFDAIVQVIDGQIELTIGGEAVPAEAGQIVVMPANVPHAVKATERFKMLLIMIRG